MAKYPVIEGVNDGWSELIFPDMKHYKMACCDCCLIHAIRFTVYETTKKDKNGNFEIIGKAKSKTLRVGIEVKRDNRATAAMRRGKNATKKKART